MSKKQTAVDWLYDKIKSHFEHDGDLLESFIMTTSIAKQKEREQIEESFDKGELREFDRFLDGEQYYTQTYGKCTPQS